MGADVAAQRETRTLTSGEDRMRMLLPRFIARSLTLVGWLGAQCCCLDAVAEETPVPSAVEMRQLIKREPLSLETWPGWRERLIAWMPDKSRVTDAAYDAAREFIKGQSMDGRSLPETFATDHFAWYLLGSAHIRDYRTETK